MLPTFSEQIAGCQNDRIASLHGPPYQQISGVFSTKTSASDSAVAVTFCEIVPPATFEEAEKISLLN